MARCRQNARGEGSDADDRVFIFPQPMKQIRDERTNQSLFECDHARLYLKPLISAAGFVEGWTEM